MIELSRQLGIPFRADKLPEPALRLSWHLINDIVATRSIDIVRRFWFGTYVGNEDQFLDARERLRRNGFEPVLFRGSKGREKGVDIALTKEMLVNAFNKNFDEGVLIAGDEDYVGLVNEVKRYGPVICGAFFEQNLSPELRLSLDRFQVLDMKSRADDVEKTKTQLQE